MRLLAALLRFFASLLRRLPLRPRVALLSRQSAAPSLDYRLLAEELRARLGQEAVVVCLSDPETKRPVRFALNTARQLYYACTSKVVVVDGYVPAVSIPRKDERIFVVQLWHALGAIKKFGYQCLDTPAGRSSESARVGRMHRNYDLVVAGGPGAVDAYAQAFDCPRHLVKPLGLPRVDYLLDERDDGPHAVRMRRLAERFPFLGGEERIVLYAPTLRSGAARREGWLTDAVRAVAADVEGTGALCVVAAHPLDRDFDPALLDEFACLRRVEGVATIDLAGFADELVTDYSSVAFEAALIGVPVRFYAPDLDEYRASPGLNVDVAAAGQDDLRAYLAGIGPGATARIADEIESALTR